MGADYIPEDNLLGRVTPDVTRKLLNDAAAANMNTIRVWGGGHYPSDVFYDTCDELGLLVWEDFMFACAAYNLTPAFETNIRAEFEDNIKRIRSHPSLAVWCGNNEMEQFAAVGMWNIKGKLVSDYFQMYEYIIPHVLAKLDPQNPYWPASPSSGGGFDEPNDENRGDVHYWTVWHGNAPFSDYRKYYFRYVSEFGFQSFPLSKTVDMITDDEKDRNIFSYIMEKHQRNNAANGKIMNYMYRTFLYPSGFDTVLYASHLLQMEAIKYGAEHFRQYRGRCMGVIYWQLNDCWPVASWASIDYSGRWKALHYAAKRFYAPILLSCEEEGLLTQDDNVNAEPHITEKSIRMNVANETRQDQEVTVTWALRDASGQEIGGGKQTQGAKTLTVPALSSVWRDKHEFPNADIHSDYVSYACAQDGKIISEGTVIFSLPKFFKWVDPQLTYSVTGDEITVTAAAYARSVEILNENEDLVLSDNYFDLNADSKTVKVLRGKPEGIKLRSVYDIK
jgi:beta-mannosidase